MSVSRGFSLIEVLVSSAVLAIGLLGIAGLMVKGQRASFEAYQRQQALDLAQDMVERMRSNPSGADDYVTGVTDTAANMPGKGDVAAPGINCEVAVCNATALQKFDRKAWDDHLTGATEVIGANKVGGIINARGCVEETDVPNRYVVSVSWQGSVGTVLPNTVACADSAGNPWPTSNCGLGLYGDANKRRLVSLCLGTRQTAP